MKRVKKVLTITFSSVFISAFATATAVPAVVLADEADYEIETNLPEDNYSGEESIEDIVENNDNEENITNGENPEEGAVESDINTDNENTDLDEETTEFQGGSVKATPVKNSPKESNASSDDDITLKDELNEDENGGDDIKESDESKLPADGWNDLSGESLYYKKGVPYTGWINENGKYYFTYEGKKYTGWKQMGKKEGESTVHFSYFGDDGVLRTGWVQLGQGTNNPDGNTAKHWSYFGDNGWLRTGWAQLGQGTNNPDGNAAKHWSYFGENGWLRTGWAQLGQGTNNPDGNAAKHWSYFGENGWLRTGWTELGQGTGNPDGAAAKHWSYFGDNGWLTIGTKKISGMTCTFNDSGWLRRYETLTPHYNQHAYGYSTGCGGVSLFMALRYKGKLTNWTLQQFMSTMPYSSDGNPNNGFVGSPYNFDLTPANRAIYPAALAKWGSRYGNVSDISGCSMDYMMNEVRNGNPAIALATWNLSDYPITQYSWGKYRDYNHHFFVMVGYDYATDRYKVMDALLSNGDGSKWVTGASFRKVWNGIKGAVVVR